jgi:hypothetical protein
MEMAPQALGIAQNRLEKAPMPRTTIG